MKLLRPMRRKQSGQALPMALVLLALGAMIIVPTLSFTTTNLTATRVVDEKTRNIYAADAGVEQGLWKVEHNDLPFAMSEKWNETTYDTYELNPYTYSLYDNDDTNDIVTVNNRNVDVEIKPIWALEGLEASSLPQERTLDPNDHVLTFGGLNGDGDYEISIFSDGTVDPLLVQRIGCWLPPGFHYDENGVCNLEEGSYFYVFNKSPHNGGEKLTWDFPTPIDYEDLPGPGSKRIVTFEFTPSEEPIDAFSWTRTSRPDFPLSWDMSKKVYEITSRAPSGSTKQTTISAHSIKKEFQALGSAITGDYQATGTTLMRDHNNDSKCPCTSGLGCWLWCAVNWGGDKDRRERLYNETAVSMKSKTEDPTYGIPEDATVEQIFLYWTGWKCKPWDVRSYTPAQLAALPLSPTGKCLDKVRLKVNVNGTEFNEIVTATTPPQVMSNLAENLIDPNGWTYSCFANVTNQVNDYFEGQGVHFYGNATYTVGHWDAKTPTDPGYDASTYRYALYTWNDNHTLEPPPTIPPNPPSPPSPPLYTRYPLGSPMDGNQSNTIGTGKYEDSGYEDQWSHSAWSVVIIYSSPSSTGHHLYIYDTFRHCNSHAEIPFTIKGFLAPPDVASDPNAARMTCFVAEGDNQYTGDRFQVNGHDLPNPPDGVNPVTNVWNGKSNVLGGASSHEGVDIDTFIAGGGTIILPGATQANILMPTDWDNWNLVYIVLSFRSTTTTGGMIDYSIK